MRIHPKKHRGQVTSPKASASVSFATEAAKRYRALAKDTVANLKKQLQEEDDYEAGKAIARALSEIIVVAANNEIPLHELDLKGFSPYMALSTTRNEKMVVYYAVAFYDGSQLYSYRSNDQTLVVGDHVIVPVGPDNEEKEAVIKKIEMTHPSKTPYPYEKMKEIIRRL